MLTDVLTLVGVLGVAGINVVGIKIQTKSKEKTEDIDRKISAVEEKFNKKTEKFEQMLNEFKKESAAADERIDGKIEKGKYYMLKVFLTEELTKVLNGAYIPNEEQKRILREAFGEYKKLHGNSYVEDLFNKCVEKGLI